MAGVTHMRIGELAETTGVSTRALRYYEEHGLLASHRSSGGQRFYDDDAPARVRWIQALFAAGVSSTQAQELLPCIHDGHTTPEMVASLEAQRSRLDERITRLTATRERLDEAIATARRLSVEPVSS
ncbi:MerR family transcriptional regulator [Pseudonocardia phyllosphaerae]|uniref:MerR family transcriptional regulator n=1 Tax=Pseudonocardia phyllosphaerae TaxID=3390502 RepID=UPI00397B008D